MFEMLDIMISLAVVFLILSMVHKYLMSMVKRLLKVKASVIAEEMKTFVGENTSRYLIPYIKEHAKHLNILEETKDRTGLKKGETGLRQLNKQQLKDVIDQLKNYLETNSLEIINEKLHLEEIEDDFEKVKEHLGVLKGRVENMYENTMERISELYESRLRVFTLIAGLLLAVCINADFFEIYSSLSINGSSREILIARADTISAEVAKLNTALEDKEEIKDLKQEFKNAHEDIDEITGNLQGTGVILGWTDIRIKNTFRGFGSFIHKLIGLFMSGLLISFGAPFWNDFLSSFIGLRRTLRGSVQEKAGVDAKGLRIP